MRTQTFLLFLALTSFNAAAQPGTELWHLCCASSSAPSVGPDGTIYVGVSDSLYAVTPDGAVKWNFATGNTINAPSANGEIVVPQ